MSMIREIALALVGPITLSLWGAIYFGYRHSPLFAVIVWTMICTAYFLWWGRDLFRYMFGLDKEVSTWFNGSLVLAIVVIVGATFLGGNALVYVLVGSISN
jgi:hypothetical protein